MRKLLADTAASLTYWNAIMTVDEYYIAGMDLETIVKSRATGIIVNALIGRPNAKYRELIYAVTNTTEQSSLLRTTAADLFAYLSFGIPLYASMTYLAGATMEQTLRGCASLVGIVAVATKPYCNYMRFVEKAFGVQEQLVDGRGTGKSLKEADPIHQQGAIP